MLSTKDYIPKKILMTADTVGGVWVHALELIGSLKQYGIEFVLAAMGGRLNSAQMEQISKLKNVDLRESDFKLEWMDNPWEDVDKAGEWLMAIKDETKPDLLHTNSYSHAAMDWKIPVLTGAHSCVYSWFREVKRTSPPQQFEIYKRRVTAGLNNSDITATPSKYMLHLLEAEYGKIRSSRVIYNGRNPKLFRPGKKENLIVSAGRIWDEAKNIQALAKAAPSIKWKIKAAGEGSHPVTGEVFLSKNLELTGNLSQRQTASLFGRAAIYVLPARYEPFGLSVLEAALSGCVLVLGNIPSLKEVWGDAAVYVNPEDPEEISGKINDLIDMPGLRQRLSMKAYKRGLRYTPEKMAIGYLNVYEDLIKHNKAVFPGDKIKKALYADVKV